MIGIMRSTIKTGARSCVTPANSLCIKVLILLREHGFIYGFSHISFINKHLYPRVLINFKYTDNNTPVLRDLKSFKNTHSNFTSIQAGSIQILSQNKLYILTTPTGLQMTSLADLSANQLASTRKGFKGKLLLEISV
jgi:ribosomal protein S8